MAHIIELIASTSITGDGTENHPVRNVIELWTKDGELIASYDTQTKDSYFLGPYLPSLEAKIAQSFTPESGVSKKTSKVNPNITPKEGRTE